MRLRNEIITAAFKRIFLLITRMSSFTAKNVTLLLLITWTQQAANLCCKFRFSVVEQRCENDDFITFLIVFLNKIGFNGSSS